MLCLRELARSSIGWVMIAGLMLFNIYLCFLYISKSDVPELTAYILHDQILQKCSSESILKAKSSCYIGQIRLVTERYGLKMGIQTLIYAQKYDPLLLNCHLLGHYIAHSAYKSSNKDIRSLLNNVEVRMCGSGLFHGLIEAYLIDKGKVALDTDLASEICDGYEDRYRTSTCYHFLGHVLTLQQKDVVPNALNICEKITSEYASDCYNGVFMEHNQKVMLSDHLIVQKPVETIEYADALGDECNRYSGPKAHMCWIEIAELYAHASNYDQKTIFNGCHRAINIRDAEECYKKGMGIMSVQPRYEKPEDLMTICAPYENDIYRYRWCLNTIVLTFAHFSPALIHRGIGFCSNIPEANRGACFELLRYGYVHYTHNEQLIKDTCHLVDKKYERIYCLGEKNKE